MPRFEPLGNAGKVSVIGAIFTLAAGCLATGFLMGRWLFFPLPPSPPPYVHRGAEIAYRVGLGCASGTTCSNFTVVPLTCATPDQAVINELANLSETLLCDGQNPGYELTWQSQPALKFQVFKTLPKPAGTTGCPYAIVYHDASGAVSLDQASICK